MIAEYKNRIHVLVVAGVLVQLLVPFVAFHESGAAYGAGFALGAAGTLSLVAGFCYYAKARGHHPAWGLLGLVLGLIAIIILAWLPDRTQDEPGGDAAPTAD
ncbi:MAG: hypothetical protein JSV65_12615 [Armatimonadota bacterium]|nr:MAG: hypothetical protein JSV65_12615 [Armatimonadota bacterium]